MFDLAIQARPKVSEAEPNVCYSIGYFAADKGADLCIPLFGRHQTYLMPLQASLHAAISSLNAS